MSAKHTQAAASTAKRTATALRTIAGSAGVSYEDRGIMLAAARAVDAFAGDKARLAKRQKREEQDRDRFYAKNEFDARAIIAAEWPQATLLDKCAILAAESMLHADPTNARLSCESIKVAADLAYWLDAAIRSAASSAVYNAWHKKTPLREAITDRAQRVAEMRASERVAVAAARIAEALEPRSTTEGTQ